MSSEENLKQRKIARDFKGRIEMMKHTSIEILESMFLELYNYGLEEFIKKEMERYPNKSRKEIILDMYKIHDKLKGMDRKGYAK
ncbi:MAG: hypothetical protein GF353_10990 [Candidatus Lokiarchaeota archaeon]|nr:hypothetical protein [Candidatus Lokiarchaeota archaeon]